MLVLGLDTSTPAVSAAVVELADGDPPRWGRSATRTVEPDGPGPQRHGELLAVCVRDALQEMGADRRDLTAVAVGLGPGPFTGLRVGIATAAALCDALGIPAYGCCSLDAVAAWDDGAGSRLVVTDARRREVYWAEYDGNDQRVAGPVVMTPAALESALRETSWSGRVLGDGALRYRAHFAAYEVVEHPRYPAADALVLLAARRVVDRAPGEALTPLYLRRPDAVPPGASKKVSGWSGGGRSA
ncbi:MAG: peptidase glycoprotease [Frankiales bacterium]|nr:peptidase glycoprotease [Frankiales bacterium]